VGCEMPRIYAFGTTPGVRTHEKEKWSYRAELGRNTVNRAACYKKDGTSMDDLAIRFLLSGNFIECTLD